MSKPVSLAVLLVSLLGSTTIPAVPDASESVASREQTVRLLLERVDTFMRLYVDGNHSEAYQMVLEMATREEWVKHQRRMARRVRFTTWAAYRVCLLPEIARVDLALSGMLREGLIGWEPFEEPMITFWVLENGDWFKRPTDPVGWDEATAECSEVSSDQNQVKTIRIQTR